MPYIDDARRWLKDHLSHDQYFEAYGASTPKKSLHAVEEALLDLTPSERIHQLNAVKDFSTVYYEGRHNEQIPLNVRQELWGLERRVERLNRVEAARERLMELGGPPSRETITEALERSAKERQAHRVDRVIPHEPERHSEREAIRESVGMRMGM